MLTFSIIIPVLAAAGADPSMLVAFVVVGLLILTALTGIGAQPRKKKYCPFCRRQIDYPKLAKGTKLLCPYCGETADSNP